MMRRRLESVAVSVKHPVERQVSANGFLVRPAFVVGRPLRVMRPEERLPQVGQAVAPRLERAMEVAGVQGILGVGEAGVLRSEQGAEARAW